MKNWIVGCLKWKKDRYDAMENSRELPFLESFNKNLYILQTLVLGLYEIHIRLNTHLKTDREEVGIRFKLIIHLFFLTSWMDSLHFLGLMIWIFDVNTEVKKLKFSYTIFFLFWDLTIYFLDYGRWSIYCS